MGSQRNPRKHHNVKLKLRRDIEKNIVKGVKMKNSINSYIEKRLENESFREEWAQSEDAYQAARLLLQLRNEQNLTQTELALLSSKKQSYIARIESGHYNVSFKVLNEIVQSAGRKLDIRLK